jgi:hypothetical protein
MKAEEMFASICTGMSLEKVASTYGMTTSGVWNSLRRAGLPTSHRAAVRAGVVVLPMASSMKTVPKRLCWRGYASILRAVQVEPLNITDIAIRLQCGLNNLRRIINRMHDLRLVHIARWDKRKDKKNFQAVWAFGGADDAPYPDGSKKPGTPRGPNAWGMHRPELIAFANIIRALAVPVTRAELVECSGSTSCNISRLMRHCAAIKLVRIAAWDTSKPGKPAAALQLGTGPDAPRPKPSPRKEIQRRCRAATKQRSMDQRFMRALATPGACYSQADA